MKYLCSECDYETDNLSHYRFHLSQQHTEFKHRIPDSSLSSRQKCGYCPFLATTQAEFSAHIETHFGERRYRCSVCHYSAFDKQSVNRHIAARHMDVDDARLLDLQEESRLTYDEVLVDENGEKTDIPLVVNLEPEVKVARISDSVLSQYHGLSPANYSDEDTEVEEEVSGNVASLLKEEIDHVDPSQEEEMEDVEPPMEDVEPSVEDAEGRENTNDTDGINNDFNDNLDMQNEGLMQENCEKEDSIIVASINKESEYDENSEYSVSQSSSKVDPNGEMMIMEFGNVINGGTSSRSSPLIPHRSKDSLLSANQGDEDNGSDVANVLNGGDDDDDDDDDDDVYGDDVTLSSPLPVFSLGDEVPLSP